MHIDLGSTTQSANVGKKQIGQLSYRTPYAIFAAGTSDKTTPMKNNIVGAKSFWDTSLQKKTTPLLDEGDHSGASDILPWKKGHQDTLIKAQPMTSELPILGSYIIPITSNSSPTSRHHLKS